MLLAGVLLALTVLVPSASAATKTVRLTNDGPVPASLVLKAGDKVVFTNDDNVPHQVRSQGGWQYDSGPIPPGQTSATTPVLTAPGSYKYSDQRGIVVLPRTFVGELVVPAPKPTPTPTHSPSPRPSPSPSASPPSSPTLSPAPSPTASPTPSPTPVVTPSATPSPSALVLPTPPSVTLTPAPDVRYGAAQGLVQSSPHRYGLPALVAGVALGGVLSLLARFLLALPEGRPSQG